MIICPKPNKWNEVYLSLKSEWEKEDKKGDPPPIPLILAGWNYSNDYDKHERWSKTKKWAKKHGFLNYITELEESDYYITDIMDKRRY